MVYFSRIVIMLFTPAPPHIQRPFYVISASNSTSQQKIVIIYFYAQNVRKHTKLQPVSLMNHENAQRAGMKVIKSGSRNAKAS